MLKSIITICKQAGIKAEQKRQDAKVEREVKALLTRCLANAQQEAEKQEEAAFKAKVQSLYEAAMPGKPGCLAAFSELNAVLADPNNQPAMLRIAAQKAQTDEIADRIAARKAQIEARR
jgi:hypothetical protein